MNEIISITDKHITPKFLPAEPSSCWIKWKKGVNVDKIVLRYEADIDVFRLFNVDQKVFEHNNKNTGEIIIPKDMIQLDGFFGFSSKYTAIIQNERKLSYEIDVVAGDGIQTIHFENIVTRPMIKVLTTLPDLIRISKHTPPPENISLKIKSINAAALYDLSFFVEFSTSDNLTVESRSERSKSSEITFESEYTDTQNISIVCKESGMMKIGVKYYDGCRTKYTEILKEIPIIVECKDYQTILISGQIEKQKTGLLIVQN